MAQVNVILPALGEGIIEATITRWLYETGAEVEFDNPLVEIATDKVDSEVMSPASGILIKKLCQEGEIAKVGDVIAIIETESGEPEEEPEEKKSNPKNIPNQTPEYSKEPVLETVEGISDKADVLSGTFLSPLVKSIATKENLSVTDINKIRGTGLHNRITKDDVFSYLKIKTNHLHESPKTEVIIENKHINNGVPKSKIYGDSIYEIVEMDRMRKLISEHMVMSKQVSPHVTSFVETDVTNIVKWRDKNKDAFLKREGQKLTFMPLFVEAVTKAIKDFPMVNVSVDGDKIVVKKNVNIGMATALPSGNLIVPVIKDADKLNLSGLAGKINDLAERARINKLQPTEIQGGTFTITNVGTFGNITGTPIINQPEVAILAIGAIKKKPAVLETEDGDVIAIRHIMVMSLSYDHRVVDGGLGGMFLKKISDYLEAFNPATTF